MRILVRALVACVASTLTMATGAVAQEASGALWVNGEELVLGHAAAIAEAGTFDPSGEDVRVFITDRPMPATALADEFERDELLFGRRLQGMVLLITADQDVISATYFHPELPETGMSAAGGIRFEPGVHDAGTVSGRVRWEHDRLRYEADFSAPVYRRPPVTEEVLASEPAQAVLAFARAAAAGDREGLKAVLRAQDAADLDGPEGEEIMEILAWAELDRMAILWMDVQGDSARVLLGDPDGGGSIRFMLALEDGRWRIGSPMY